MSPNKDDFRKYINYPELSSLRSDPRLAALRKKVGLPE
jgi:hypothetical protein